MELPNWALVVMFSATAVGFFQLGREMLKRFG